MPTLKEKLEELFESATPSVITQENMQLAGEALRDVLTEHGLGTALMVAHLHGLKVGHIPLMRDASGHILPEQCQVVHDTGADDYVFAHIPVRQYRSDKPKLAELGIINQKADPVAFIYHEDGLIGTFSFDLNAMSKECSRAFNVEDISVMLDHLARQGILTPANVNNRQIQFKDTDAKRTIEQSRQKVYVKFDRSLREQDLILPGSYDCREVRQYILSVLRFKTACNYCSVNALCPREITIHSTPVNATDEPQAKVRRTVRNYQFGFTFAPFGDPREVCHFLAWDFPHINEQVMNMDPQWYSFSDLITLVTVINNDIKSFHDKYQVEGYQPISGVCNHWAGNSIYHQHYQFFKLADIPVLSTVNNGKCVTNLNQVTVRRLDWAMAVYDISSSREDNSDNNDIMFVADRVASQWEKLNDSFDLSYGNGIRIKNHTQNIFVTQDGEKTRAIFVPRLRSRLKATSPKYGISKDNLGVLETLGYFIIDNPADFETLRKKTPAERNELGATWLADVAPPEEGIQEFERQLAVGLTSAVVGYEQKLNDAANRPTPEERRDHILNTVYQEVLKDSQLDGQQCSLLLEMANELLRTHAPGDVFAPERIVILAQRSV